ncbi:MAG: retention module-containing protein, partial [Gammaproteobacteria bacterium]|nr:retention module-containing protein [Gammaproteobacteria bacterium]
MATKSIGYVAELIGDAQVRGVDGVIRILSIGDQINEGDILTTGVNTEIVLEFHDGRRLQLGENTEILLDESVFASLTEYPDDRADQLAELQSLIVEGIDLAELEATAAGEAGNANDALHQASIYSRDGDEGIVETRGTPLGFDSSAIDNLPTLGEDPLLAGTGATGENAAPSTSPAPTPAASISVDDITADDIVNLTEAAGAIDVTGTVGGDAGPGDSVTFTINGNPYFGIVAADNTFTVTVSGSDLAAQTSFVATVNGIDVAGNPFSASTASTHTYNSTPPNSAPVAVDDAVTAMEDTPFNSVIELDANDTDLDGDTLSVVAGTFGTAQGGSITIAADGSYTYTPAANFNGVDTVDYTVTDGSLTDVGTLTINVTAVNDAPVAVDDSVTATEDTPFSSTVDLDFNDTDLDGDSLSVVAGTFATAQGGSITIAADGSYTYTPAANFNGVDTVDYTVTDGSLTDVGTLTINVTAVNDAPVAVDDSVTATEDTPFNSVIELDANDTDLDGDALSVVAGTFGTAQGGSITIAADGIYTYTPAANFNGVDTVDYTVTDGSLTDVGTLTINVTAVNDAPVAVDDAVTATEDTPFSSTVDLDFNDTDLDGDALSVVAGTFATAQGGSITIAADGSYTYTPAANFNGTDTVDYTVTDGSLTDIGTLTINVTAVNDAPVAVDDAVTATEDTPFNSVIELDANDTDLDGDTLSVVAGTFATAQGGSITIAADGSYTYTPAANFNGTDTVDYTVTDGNLTDVGTLTINVTAVNDAPVAVDDAVTATEDTPFSSTVDLDFNDTDLDGD